MHISEEGLKLIKRFEGCKLKAYKDAAGVPTIGYGHTSNVVLGQVITEKKAEEYLRQDVLRAEAQVMRFNKIYNFNQSEFDALTSFAFNLGSITGLTKFGKRSRVEIAEKMLLYVKAGGKTMQGLVNRRKAEHDMFLETPKPNIDTSHYQVGQEYTVVVNGLTVRKAPYVEAPKALKNGYNKGKKVTCYEVVLDTNGNIWLKIDSQKNFYYICAIYKGKVYVD